MKNIFKYSLLSLFSILVGAPLFALPATLSLPRGLRPGLKPLTLSQAAEQLKGSGKTGLALVEAARHLVAQRMQYCRRNSFDTHTRAFERGYGYCQQQAFALVDLLTRLGFNARVVGALRNRFPDGRVTGHAWVRVFVAKQAHDIDSIAYDPTTGQITFTPLTRVFEYNPAFRIFAAWGSSAVNAWRYYRSGKDYDQ
jgi:transglutaminase-like putative cysteine protease